jgi:hypothetical protein
LLLALSWGRKPDVKTNIVYRDTVIYITLTEFDTIYKPEIVEVIKKDTIREPDTVFVYNDYYAVNRYADTLRNDSLAFAYIEEYVSQNKIQERIFRLKVNERQQTITNTVTKTVEKSHLYLGVDATTNNGLYLGATFKTRYKGIYNVGYDPVNNSLMIGVKFRAF